MMQFFFNLGVLWPYPVFLYGFVSNGIIVIKYIFSCVHQAGQIYSKT